MPCSCHGSKGESVKVAKPYDQCVLCARKHIKNAWGAFHEFTYEDDNRDFVSDQLRKAADHLKIIHRETALKCRDLAMQIEENRDAPDLARQLDELRIEARNLFYLEHEEAQERLKQLQSKPDVIIPLGNGSSFDNAELKILLRSIEKHLKNYNRIFLCTHYAPKWIDQSKITIVDIDDVYSANKDANLHNKILQVIKKYNVDWFVFAADDNVIMQDVSASALPVLQNGKDRANFEGENQGKWQTRVKHTFEWADEMGVNLQHHFEVHAPQLFKGKLLAEKMQNVDFEAQPGLTIYTTWRVLTDTYKDALKQGDYKLTFENALDEAVKTMPEKELQSKLFVGYSDAGIKAGLLDRLFNIFDKPSKFEKE